METRKKGKKKAILIAAIPALLAGGLLFAGNFLFEFALYPDALAHGESDGKFIGMGWLERPDVLAWTDAIIQKDPEAEIILHGVSMGGATVMMASGEDLPDNVRCIVEDCGYSSAWDEFSLQLKNVFHLPAFPVLNAVSIFSKLRRGTPLRRRRHAVHPRGRGHLRALWDVGRGVRRLRQRGEGEAGGPRRRPRRGGEHRTHPVLGHGDRFSGQVRRLRLLFPAGHSKIAELRRRPDRLSQKE